jgi:hypothetical protein
MRHERGDGAKRLGGQAMCRRSCARASGSGAGAALGAGGCDGREGVSPEPEGELARLTHTPP